METEIPAKPKQRMKHVEEAPKEGRGEFKRVSKLRDWERKLLDPKAEVYSKRDCSHCHGRGILGLAHATVRKVHGKLEVFGEQKVFCGCVMVWVAK